VTDSCPECGTPVWSTPSGTAGFAPGQVNQSALTWGIVSVVVFAFFGPFALFAAAPAIIQGRAAMRKVKDGTCHPSLATSARTGLILGWVTVGLSAVCVFLIAASLLIFLLRLA
jgi:hypothetical protein